MVDIMAWALPNRSSSSRGERRAAGRSWRAEGENAELRAKLEALEAELEKLKREMGRDSSNPASHRRPTPWVNGPSKPKNGSHALSGGAWPGKGPRSS